MTRKWEPPNGDDLIKRYRSGESIGSIARNLSVSSKAVNNFLRRNGVEIRSKVIQSIPGLVERYQSGESVKSIADSTGVARTVVQRLLIAEGIHPRGQVEANRLLAAERTPEQHRANTQAAHAAVRGRPQSAEHRVRIAVARERNQTSASPAELLLAEWLKDLGPTPQKAVGPYNVDLAIGPVAVEVFGGHWHSHGHHAARTPERARYILDQGWLLVVVWVTAKHRLQRPVADHLRSLVQQASGNPSLAGQYRVVWGDGEDATAACPDLNHLALVPTIRRGADSGP